MDILLQSLKAADILGGDNDDLFGELGLTFNGNLQPAGLPNELQSLTGQDNALQGNGSGISSLESYGNGDNSFDTSQFLNPVSILPAGASQGQPSVSTSTGVSVIPIIQPGSQQSALHYGTIPKLAQSSVSNTQLPFATSSLTLTTTVAQNAAVAACASVFSKAPTQTLTSTVQTHQTLPLTNAQAYAVSSSLSQPVQMSAPIQVLQTLPQHALHQQSGGQVVTLVQKPTVLQLNAGVAHNTTVVQNVNGLVVQPAQNNVAVLKIPVTKSGLNLNDPQVIKALTANLVQKQTQAVSQQLSIGQSTQPQFIKLSATQNSSLLNVVSQRPQQNVGVPGTQQITLANGQKILMNNSQQVQMTTTQTPGLQLRTGQSHIATQNVALNGAMSFSSTPAPTVRNTQVPIKGIQIASVNIPIITSSGGVGSVGSLQGNTVMTIPVVTKPNDVARHTVSQSSVGGAPTIITVAQAGSAQSSATVRGLLANVIQKQGNLPSSSGVNMHAVVRLPQAGSQLPNGQVALPSHLGASARLSVPNQRSQMMPVQLPNMSRQHQDATLAKSLKSTTGHGAGLHARQSSVKAGNTATTRQNPTRSSPTPVTAASSTSNAIADRHPVQVFKVDPTITQAQVDEVKKLLTSRTIASKLHCLSKEQQQLVLAFQAQIKTMSSPVQQYYLRNPQLFMQKVLQQTRNGKPFVLQIKSDALQKAKPNTTVSLPTKSQHPTISLTTDSSRTPVSHSRMSTPPVAGGTLNGSQVLAQKQPVLTTVNHKTAVKRPAPVEAPNKVTLVVEQLDCHKRMMMKPDCVNRFSSVRDAIRRLVPYHTCNIPDIERGAFDESEELFDQISDRIVKKSRSMIDKYHLLRLRDSTRDSCSADMVMIERMFLQREKAKYAEDKARLEEDPSLIREYFPRKESRDGSEVEDLQTDPAESQKSNNQSSNDEESAMESMDSTTLSAGDKQFDNRLDYDYENNSTTFSADNAVQADDCLLQEAVDSILI